MHRAKRRRILPTALQHLLDMHKDFLELSLIFSLQNHLQGKVPVRMKGELAKASFRRLFRA